MDCSGPDLPVPISWSLPKFLSISSVMPSSHLILWHPFLLLPSIFPSIKDFSNESALRIRWPKYWSFSFSISPSNEYSGLISLKIDWDDLLAVQRTLRSHLQHHISKASILQCSVFFTVHLSQPYMTTEKTIAFTRRTLVGKVMSLILNMLSRLVITFLPRNLLISWLQSPSAVILEYYSTLKRNEVGSFVEIWRVCHTGWSTSPGSWSRHISWYLQPPCFMYIKESILNLDSSHITGRAEHKRRWKGVNKGKPGNPSLINRSSLISAGFHCTDDRKHQLTYTAASLVL